MRIRKTTGGLTVNAVAGAHVVFLGMNIAEELRAGLRGFAVRRHDNTEKEIEWMRGTKVFESLIPTPAPGVNYSSAEHPFQSFQWSDYSAKPGYNYLYEVHALYGQPGDLKTKFQCDVEVATEKTDQNAHIVNFNRGSPASQEYARKFGTKLPKAVGEEAYKWLSRGLEESILEFIARATDQSFGLKGAFYEFQWPRILDALHNAKTARGVDVHVVFDDIDNETGPHDKNETAIKDADLNAETTARTRGTLMHNKFLVLTRKEGQDEVPEAVLFGSTNLTENGIFGHANLTHVINDVDIARKYLALHDKLTSDPATTNDDGKYQDWIGAETPAPLDALENDLTVVFSPRHGESVLKWYGDLAGRAKDALFMTFAFGMNQVFRDVYGRDDAILRMALMEKEWNGANKDAQIAAIRVLQARTNVLVAIGNRIPLTNLDQWLLELDHITGNTKVHWIHLKFMLVDPLSDEPLIITGSANFSPASTTANDENMVIIRNALGVTDIYFGEYMRLYNHYAFREAVAIWLQKNPGAGPSDFRQGFLIEKNDWTAPYFDPEDKRAGMPRRLYFSQSG